MSRWPCSGEALAGRHRVLVDHAQDAEAHEALVVVAPEREGVPRVEPAVVGVAPLPWRAGRQSCL